MLLAKHSLLSFCCAIAAVLNGCSEQPASHKQGPREHFSELPLGPIPPDTEIAAAVGLASGGPVQARYCGGIGFVDLGSATDGPAYYFRKSDGHIVGACGGYCMADPSGHCKTDCPPAGWTCRER